MPFSISCPCGKTYTKPDHKAGTLFRCHMCGRELAIPDSPAAAAMVSIADGEQEEDEQRGAGVEPDSGGGLEAAPRPSILRGAFAWGLIVLGLTAVVGGLGQIYIFSIVEKMRADDARTRALLFVDFQARQRPTPDDALLAYTIAFGFIILGLVFTYVGFRVRSRSR
jgi:hypothetical protein